MLLYDMCTVVVVVIVCLFFIVMLQKANADTHKTQLSKYFTFYMNTFSNDGLLLEFWLWS